MTFEQKIYKLSAYQRKKAVGIALRADLDYWEAFSTSFLSNDTGGGGGSHNTEHSPTENAASRALDVRRDIEKNIAELLRERERLIDLISKLKEPEQDIMYLVYVSGFSMKDAAKYMNLTPNAVSKRHRKIIENLVL